MSLPFTVDPCSTDSRKSIAAAVLSGETADLTLPSVRRAWTSGQFGGPAVAITSSEETAEPICRPDRPSSVFRPSLSSVVHFEKLIQPNNELQRGIIGCTIQPLWSARTSTESTDALSSMTATTMPPTTTATTCMRFTHSDFSKRACWAPKANRSPPKFISQKVRNS